MQASPRTTQLQGWGIAVLRIVAGYLFLVSGVEKVFSDTPTPFGISISLPLPISVALMLTEVLGGVALILGLLTRWVSVPLAFLMLADILVVHPPNALLEDQGYGYALIRLAASVTLVLTGSGKVALDNILAIRRGPK
jgi:putative oxidoreductase